MSRLARVRALDFEFQRAHRARWPGLAVAAVGALIAGGVVYEYVETSQRVNAWQAKLGEVRRMADRKRGALDASPRDPAALRQEIRVANGVLQQIALPWDSLFSELERNRDRSVALLSVQPDLQSRIVRIGGEARNLRAVVEYARRLDAASMFRDVHIVSHEVRTDEPQRPVVFSLAAGWR